MRRHELDLTSLIAGIVLAAIAAAYLLAAATGRSVDGAWVLPVGLIGLGLAGLAGSLRRARAIEPVSDEMTDPVA